MMRRIATLLAFLLASTGCCHSAPVVPPKADTGAAQQCDRLSPVGSRLTDPDPRSGEYDAVISATLLSQVPQPTSETAEDTEELIMVMVKDGPSTPQEATYVLQTPPRPTPPQYRVVHARATEPIVFQRTAVPANVTEAPLDAELVLALERSWGAMALGARWPDREANITRKQWRLLQYTFDYRGDNVYGQGEAFSPDVGTCSAALADIGDLLMRFADERDTKKRGAIRAGLLRRCHALAERIERGR